MLALLAACAAPPSEPDPTARATLEIIGHHCDGDGVDGIAVHVDKPGIAVIHWSNKNA
jgi:hypothetical protein